jgi:hypothetical protein
MNSRSIEADQIGADISELDSILAKPGAAQHLQPTLNKALAHVLSQLFPPIEVIERRVFRAPPLKACLTKLAQTS